MGLFGNLFTRSTRVVKGQMNTAMDSIEDATFESTLQQTVRDLKEELNKIEARVKELEAQGVKRDPKFMPKDVDPDLAYSKEHVSANRDKFYRSADEERQDIKREMEREVQQREQQLIAEREARRQQESGRGLWMLIGMAAIGGFFYLSFVRRF